MHFRLSILAAVAAAARAAQHQVNDVLHDRFELLELRDQFDLPHDDALKMVSFVEEGEDPSPPVVPGKLTVGKLLGKGGFGEVWQAYDRELKKNVVVKVFMEGNSYVTRAHRQRVAQIQEECGKAQKIEAAAGSSHAGLQHVMKCFEVTAGSRPRDPVLLILEDCGKESLTKFIQNFSRASAETYAEAVLAISRQGLLALDALVAGSKKFVHFDLKPDNFMVLDSACDASSDFGYCLKMIDLGGLQPFPASAHEYTPEFLPLDGKEFPTYSSAYAGAVDMYAMGGTLLAMFSPQGAPVMYELGALSSSLYTRKITHFETYCPAGTVQGCTGGQREPYDITYLPRKSANIANDPAGGDALALLIGYNTISAGLHVSPGSYLDTIRSRVKPAQLTRPYVDSFMAEVARILMPTGYFNVVARMFAQRPTDRPTAQQARSWIATSTSQTVAPTEAPVTTTRAPSGAGNCVPSRGAMIHNGQQYCACADGVYRPCEGAAPQYVPARPAYPYRPIYQHY